MYEVHPSTSILTSSLDDQKDAIAILDRRKELHIKREERMARKLRKEMEKAKKHHTEVVKVGLIMPDRMGEEEIKRELEWWEEEMKHREKLHTQQLEKEALHTAQLKELADKEQRLEDLRIEWRAARDAINLGEEELERIQNEFEERLRVELQAHNNSEAVVAETTRAHRMKEEAEKRALRKALKQDSGIDAEQQARSNLLRQIEAKASIEREVLRVRKEIGLLRQKVHGQERSHFKVMHEERSRRQENAREIPPLEELYAPIRKVVPKQEVLRSHQQRMLEAQQAKSARRTGQTPSNSVGSSSAHEASSSRTKNADTSECP